jgi:hypothetical protein
MMKQTDSNQIMFTNQSPKRSATKRSTKRSLKIEITTKMKKPFFISILLLVIISFSATGCGQGGSDVVESISNNSIGQPTTESPDQNNGPVENEGNQGGNQNPQSTSNTPPTLQNLTLNLGTLYQDQALIGNAQILFDFFNYQDQDSSDEKYLVVTQLIGGELKSNNEVVIPQQTRLTADKTLSWTAQSFGHHLTIMKIKAFDGKDYSNNEAQILVTQLPNSLQFYFKFNNSQNLLFDEKNPQSGSWTLDQTQLLHSQDHGGSLQLSKNSLFKITNFSGILGNSPRTMMLWFKTTATSGSLLSYGQNAAGALGEKWDIALYHSKQSPGVVQLDVGGGYIRGTTKINDGEWHHLAVVLPDGAQNVQDVSIFIDGQAEVIGSSKPMAINTVAALPVTIGNNHKNSKFVGLIDELSIYNQTLALENINSLANYPALPAEVHAVTPQNLLVNKITQLLFHYSDNNGDNAQSCHLSALTPEGISVLKVISCECHEKGSCQAEVVASQAGQYKVSAKVVTHDSTSPAFDYELKVIPDPKEKDPLSLIASLDLKIHYAFDDPAKMTLDSEGNSPIIRLNQVSSVFDAQVGLVANFAHPKSAALLSQSTQPSSYFNQEKKEIGVSLEFLPVFLNLDTSAKSTPEMILEVGNSTSGYSLLYADQQNLILFLCSMKKRFEVKISQIVSNQWNQFSFWFNAGKLRIYQNGEITQEVAVPFEYIAQQNGNSYLAYSQDSSCYNKNDDVSYQGMINDLKFYQRYESEIVESDSKVDEVDLTTINVK